jgi:hypothetical protein
MALHVTLTGMRGLVAPPLTMGAYHVLDSVHKGAGPFALALPCALVAAGAWRFQKMHRARPTPAAA